jgi:hypothetical protein
MLKKILLSLGLLLTATFSQYASAQAYPAGPFQNRSQLISAWQQFYNTYIAASSVTLDGVIVFSSQGFGPPANGRYYVCPGDGLIRQACPPEGPFSSVNHITEYWSQWATSTVSATYISVNGQPVYQFRDGFGPAMVKFYSFCWNRGGVYMTNCWL